MTGFVTEGLPVVNYNLTYPEIIAVPISLSIWIVIPGDSSRQEILARL